MVLHAGGEPKHPPPQIPPHGLLPGAPRQVPHAHLLGAGRQGGILGEAHPHTLAEYKGLLGLLTAQGKHRDARELKAAFKK